MSIKVEKVRHVLSDLNVDSIKYQESISEQLSRLSHSSELFKNKTVATNKIQFEEYTRLVLVLHEALTQIVTNYFKDVRIRNEYNLDAKLETILREVAIFPYQVGMFRPDILIDNEGQPKICEIGCRYPINGWMISYYLNQSIHELMLEEGKESNVYQKLLSLISGISQEFNKKEPIAYLHKKEKGTEAHLLLKELTKIGFLLSDISVEGLQLRNNQVWVNNSKVSQFIIEMDREELKEIPLEILKEITKSSKCLNDIRTIILVHDKQVLSVLYNEEIMLSYMSTDDYMFLKNYLIPSYNLNNLEHRTMLKNSDKNWILKQTSGGRGIEMFVKQETQAKQWEELLDKHWKDYMVQEYIDQEEFLIEDEWMNIVGMMLVHNKTFYGLGVYRGSKDLIINVHNGACILASTLV